MMSNPTRTPSQIQSQTQNPIQSQTQIQNQTLLPINADTRSEKRITPSTAAVLNMAATLPLVFDAELNSIRERLNIMKASPHNNNVWGRRITPVIMSPPMRVPGLSRR